MYDETLELTHEVDSEVREFFGDIVFRDRRPARRVRLGSPQSRPVRAAVRTAIAWCPIIRGIMHGGLGSCLKNDAWDEDWRPFWETTANRCTSRIPTAPAAAAGTAPRIHEPGRAPARRSGQPDSPPSHNIRKSRAARRLRTATCCLLSVYEIDDNPFQPRREFSESEIASLAESLKEHDMLQPVLVRRVGERWQLISGERRLRAAIQAGWNQVPARVRHADDRLVAELAIVENLQRKDLNAIEKALSFRRYLDQHQCTQEDLGKRLKIDRSTIANLLRLLELPKPLQLDLQNGNDLCRARAHVAPAG